MLGQISEQPHHVVLFGFHFLSFFHLPVGIAVTNRTTPSLLRIQANVTSMVFPFAPVIGITWLYFVPYCVTAASTARLAYHQRRLLSLATASIDYEVADFGEAFIDGAEAGASLLPMVGEFAK